MKLIGFICLVCLLLAAAATAAGDDGIMGSTAQVDGLWTDCQRMSICRLVFRRIGRRGVEQGIRYFRTLAAAEEPVSYLSTAWMEQSAIGAAGVNPFVTMQEIVKGDNASAWSVGQERRLMA